MIFKIECMRPYFFLFIFLFFSVGVLTLPAPLKAQDKIAPRIDIGYHQSDSAVRYLTIKVRKKVEKRFQPVGEVSVQVSLDLPDGPMELGKVVTNKKGEGEIALGDDAMKAIKTLDEYSFSAEIAETDSVEQTSESVTVKASRMKIETNDADKSIIVLLEAKNEGNWEPVAGAELGVFIQRRFGKVAVGKDNYTTDENGKVESTFDTEIPGDKDGVLSLEASLEDNDELGSISASTRAQWGLHLQPVGNFGKRTLWATRDKTPWWLLVFPNAMIAGVWGVIVYLIVSLFRIKKASKVNSLDEGKDG